PAHLDLASADPQFSRRLDRRPLATYASSIENGSVRGAQVVELEAAIGSGTQHGMFGRYGGTRDDEIGMLAGPSDDPCSARRHIDQEPRHVPLLVSCRQQPGRSPVRRSGTIDRCGTVRLLLRLLTP